MTNHTKKPQCVLQKKLIHLLLISSLPFLTNCTFHSIQSNQASQIAKPEQGLGGTGQIADSKQDGIGGTGNVADNDCDGMGGTGEKRKDGQNCDRPMLAPNDTKQPGSIKPQIEMVETPKNPGEMPNIEYVKPEAPLPGKQNLTPFDLPTQALPEKLPDLPDNQPNVPETIPSVKDAKVPLY